jgi:hypothetical protein
LVPMVRMPRSVICNLPSNPHEREVGRPDHETRKHLLADQFPVCAFPFNLTSSWCDFLHALFKIACLT